MKWLLRYLRLTRHLVRVWRAGQLRFRLETFGLYYPHPPYASPWWRFNMRSAWLLLRQLPSYARWVEEMEQLQEKGPASWWH